MLKEEGQGKLTVIKKDRRNAMIKELLTAIADSNHERDKWYLDSGATDHMSNNFKLFQNYRDVIYESTSRHLDQIASIT